jgi:hypothetical protein
MLVERPYLILFETHPDSDEGPCDTSTAMSTGGAQLYER